LFYIKSILTGIFYNFLYYQSRIPYQIPVTGFSKKSYVKSDLHITKSDGKPIKSKDLSNRPSGSIKKSERIKVWNYIFSYNSNKRRLSRFMKKK